MPGCTFSISGADFELDGFLSEAGWKVTNSYRTGQEMSRRKGHFYEDSGFWMTVSDSELLEDEIEDVERFLVVNRYLIEKASKGYGAEELTLDFGYYCRLYDDVGEMVCVSQGEHLRASFIKICGELNIGVSLSLYHPPNDEDET